MRVGEKVKRSSVSIDDLRMILGMLVSGRTIHLRDVIYLTGLGEAGAVKLAEFLEEVTQYDISYDNEAMVLILREKKSP